jgi:hypothetical protein
MLSIIRRGMGVPGEVSRAGDLLEWRSKSEVMERAITAAPVQDMTAIAGSSDLRSAAALTFLPVGLVSAFAAVFGFISAADSGNPVGMLLAVLALPVLFILLRTVFGRVSSAESARLEQVVEELGRLVAETRGDDPADDPGTP